MSDYKVLARKYRPQTFNDLVGQEVLVRTLSNAIDSNRLAHAFVLTGIRGIGKTTTARIMAKALNCIGEDGMRTTPTINPCGVCTHCVQIRDDCHIDVQELDAASNTGVDDARDLTESSHYRPLSGRYKVYIIDEAHMLSKQAFNALLKTLEEPSDNVVFIFATTELRKIPVTILSRCQRFDLRRLNMQEMVEHLRNISAKEQVNAQDEALELIAIASEGSVRDALSLLDQAISHSDKDASGNFNVKGETLRELLGLVDRTRMYELLRVIFAGEVAEALQGVQDYYQAGANMEQLVQDLLHGVHDITRLLVMPNYRFDNTYSEGERKFLHEIAGKLNVAATSQAWQIMSKGLEEIRRSSDELRATEMLVIRVCYAAQMPDPTELMKIIEGQTEALSAPKQVVKRNSDAPKAQVLEFPKPSKQAIDFTAILAICEEQKEMILRETLRNSVRLISCEGTELIISDKSELPRDAQLKLQALLQQNTGKDWKITIKQGQGQPTINEQLEQSKIVELNVARQHEIVRTVFEKFENAELIAIIAP